MRRDDRDDPFDEFFQEIERMMNEMMGGDGAFQIGAGAPETDTVHYDVHDDDETVRVVADLPGAEESAIELTCDGQTLTIDASGANREYTERIRLPRTVDEHSANATYNNGILEVTFEPVSGSTSIDL